MAIYVPRFRKAIRFLKSQCASRFHPLYWNPNGFLISHFPVSWFIFESSGQNYSVTRNSIFFGRPEVVEKGEHCPIDGFMRAGRFILN